MEEIKAKMHELEMLLVKMEEQFEMHSSSLDSYKYRLRVLDEQDKEAVFELVTDLNSDVFKTRALLDEYSKIMSQLEDDIE